MRDPMDGISPELHEGIARRCHEMEELVAHLGGYGAPVRGVGPDGVEHLGTLAPAATLDQQPLLVDAEGRRWRLAHLARAADQVR